MSLKAQSDAFKQRLKNQPITRHEKYQYGSSSGIQKPSGAETVPPKVVG